MEKRVINPWTWQERFGFVQAAETSGTERTLHCAGQTSVDENGQPLHEGQMEAQAQQALDNLETVLREAGFELADITRVNYYVTDVDAYREGPALSVRQRLVDAGCQPAATLVGVTRLALPELMFEIEATAVK